MNELLVDFITSLDGYGAAQGWPGFWGLEGPEYLAWISQSPGARCESLLVPTQSPWLSVKNISPSAFAPRPLGERSPPQTGVRAKLDKGPLGNYWFTAPGWAVSPAKYVRPRR